MTPKLTTDDMHRAHAEWLEEDAKRRYVNHVYCQHLDAIGASKAWELWVQAHHHLIQIGE